MRRKVLFALVITIIHEMTHIFWQLRVCAELKAGLCDYTDSIKEPYWELGDPKAEKGFALKRWFWGGRARAIDSELAESLGYGREKDRVVKGSKFPDETFFRVGGTIMLSRDSMAGGSEDCPETYVRVDEMVDKFWTDAEFAEIVRDFEARKKRWESQIQGLGG
jgi:hypothetical protein